MEEIREIIRKPLREFENEKPPSCTSQNLKTATTGTLTTVQLGKDFQDRKLSAEMILEVADTALKHKCYDTADKLYRSIITTFIGSGYAAYRQRARFHFRDPPDNNEADQWIGRSEATKRFGLMFT